MWSEDAQKKKDGSDSEEDEDEDESEEESDDGGASGAAAELSREERKREKKARKEAAIARAKAQTVQVGDLPPSDSEEDSDDDMPANPNHSKAARNQARQPLEEVTEAVKGLAVTSGTPSRRERESLEAQQAKERYRMLHEQGKTDEAKADLARLKVIREKREAENARKQVRALIYPVLRTLLQHKLICSFTPGRERSPRSPGAGEKDGTGGKGGQEARGCHGS